MYDFLRKIGILTVLLISACSSSHLRKFDDGDISKELSADDAKKFEVKDVTSGTPAPTPAASPVPAVSAVPKKVKAARMKKEKKKKEEAGVPAASPTPVTILIRRTEPMPFEIGEKLSYDIRYVGVTAGYFTLEVLPIKEMENRKVYHLQAHARTLKLFELIYRVNDIIESFFDYDGLYSHRFTMDLDESKQTRKLIELYDYDKKKSFYWNRVDHIEKGFKEDKQSYDISPYSQDPVSALFYLRMAKLPTEPGPEFRFPLIIDGKPWEGVMHFKTKAKIYAGGKDRMASVYSFDNYQNGELKNKDNTVWISDDEHRYVLRVEAKVKVGSFAVALDKIL